MRQRPVRSRIYLPVVRFGVVSSDWKFVLTFTLIAYLIPFFLGLRIGRVPLFLITGLLTAIGSVIFFAAIRVGRRPYWFQHMVRALVRHPRQRRALPSDGVRHRRRLWIKDV